MSEENVNANAQAEVDTRVIVELADGMVSNISANRPGVEVIIIDAVSERPDDGILTTVEHNGSAVDYMVSSHRPDHSLYDNSWEAAILAGIHSRTTAEPIL